MKRGKTMKEVKCLFLLAMMLAFAGIALGEDIVMEEGIHLIRPHSHYITDDYFVSEYLSVEDLTFVSCLEDEDITLKPSVMCLDNNNFEDLEALRWGNTGNCYVSSINLEGFDCENLRLQAEYVQYDENQRMTRDLRINKLSKVLDKILETQYSDGGWKTVSDTTYGLWSLSHFPGIFNSEMEKALAWLELERNEDYKCFPKSPCNFPLTLEILYILTLSGYDDARRVVNDARNWIEKKQNYFTENDQFSVTITAFVENSTVVLAAINQDLLDTNFSISNGTPKRYVFNVFMNYTLYILSHDNFEAIIRDNYGDLIHKYIGNNLSYTFEGSCWSANEKGEPCNALTTAYAVQFDLHDENLEEGRRWMATQINFTDTVGANYGAYNTTIDTSLFLRAFFNQTDYDTYEDYLERYPGYSVEEQFARYIDDVRNWLLFKQNNEGTWGVSNWSLERKAKHTAFAVNTLDTMGYNRTDEPIQDAERYMSDNEDLLEKNNTRALGSAFYVLRHNARPLIAIEPGVVQLKNAETIIQLFNPTTFNLEDLTYNLSPSLSGYLDIEEKEKLSAYSYRKVKIKRLSSPADDVYGYLEIRNMDDAVANIPIIITNYPSINITVSDDLTVFGRKGELKLAVQKSSHEFLCDMRWDSNELSSPSTLKVKSGSATLDINFAESVSKEEIYTGTMSCKARGESFTSPVSVYITRYSSLPLTVSPYSVVVNQSGQDVSFFIKNNLDRDLTPQITISGDSEYFDYPGSLTINPNEERNVTVKNMVPSDMNMTSALTITVSALGKQEQISMIVDIEQIPPKKTNIILIGAIFLAILFFLSGISYVIYKNRDVVLNYINKFNVVKAKQEVKHSIDKLEELRGNERIQAIINMVQLLQFQKKADEEVRKLVLANFKHEDIRKAVEVGNLSIKGLDDE
ncbi:MAG: hypothetical protein ACTSWQ_05670, partial [Candidatus Thorarchaeota archaeon]